MKVVRTKDIQSEARPMGRTVRTLLKLTNLDECTIYFGESEKGRIDQHFHEHGQELIFFPVGGFLEINGDIIEFESWDAVLLEPGDVHGNLDCPEMQTIHLAIKFSHETDKVVV